MNILICGYGNIGTHLHKEFNEPVNKLTIYDKYNVVYNSEKILKKEYDIAFVAVPTEMKDDGSADISEVIDAVKKVNAEVIIIRSTVPVGTCRELTKIKKNIVFCPEFYGTTQHSPTKLNFAILGGENQYLEKATEVFKTVKDASFRFQFSSFETAELVKYMSNCWLATKVTFCNEFAEVAKQFNISYEKLRELWLMDNRVSPSHTFVYEDKPYYDSHCLNKDVPAFVQMCREKDFEPEFMADVMLENYRMKSKYKP